MFRDLMYILIAITDLMWSVVDKSMLICTKTDFDISLKIGQSVNELRREYVSEIEGLKTKITQLEKSYADALKCNGLSSSKGETNAQFEDRKKRIVVRNLP